MEKLIIIVILAFFVQSAFVVALLFRIKRIQKANAADKVTDAEKQIVYYGIQTEEEKTVTQTKSSDITDEGGRPSLETTQRSEKTEANQDINN